MCLGKALKRSESLPPFAASGEWLTSGLPGSGLRRINSPSVHSCRPPWPSGLRTSDSAVISWHLLGIESNQDCFEWNWIWAHMGSDSAISQYLSHSCKHPQSENHLYTVTGHVCYVRLPEAHLKAPCWKLQTWPQGSCNDHIAFDRYTLIKPQLSNRMLVQFTVFASTLSPKKCVQLPRCSS